MHLKRICDFPKNPQYYFKIQKEGKIYINLIKIMEDKCKKSISNSAKSYLQKMEKKFFYFSFSNFFYSLIISTSGYYIHFYLK